MNQEIDYAEMLEIPVSTVNVVHKKRRKKSQSTPRKTTENTPSLNNVAASPLPPLKDAVLAQINERVGEEGQQNPSILPPTPQPPTPIEALDTEGALRLDPVPERIDTVRLYADDELRNFEKNGLKLEENDGENTKNGHTRYESNAEKPHKAVRLTLGIEFAAACVLCGAIFLTNVFMPSSAINTFFRGVTGAQSTETANNRIYSDFELSPIVSDFSSATLSLSDTGVLSFIDECCVYPAADGVVEEISKSEDGEYLLKIRYSNTFTGVFNGLDQIFYAVGDKVKGNVPVGFSDGEAEVQVTMYSDGELLNCFRLTEENCLAWVTEE